MPGHKLFTIFVCKMRTWNYKLPPQNAGECISGGLILKNFQGEGGGACTQNPLKAWAFTPLVYRGAHLLYKLKNKNSTNYSQFLFAKWGHGILHFHLRMLENAFPGANFKIFSGGGGGEGACTRSPLKAWAFRPSVYRGAHLLYHENLLP